MESWREARVLLDVFLESAPQAMHWQALEVGSEPGTAPMVLCTRPLPVLSPGALCYRVRLPSKVRPGERAHAELCLDVPPAWQLGAKPAAAAAAAARAVGGVRSLAPRKAGAPFAPTDKALERRGGEQESLWAAVHGLHLAEVWKVAFAAYVLWGPPPLDPHCRDHPLADPNLLENGASLLAERVAEALADLSAAAARCDRWRVDMSCVSRDGLEAAVASLPGAPAGGLPPLAHLAEACAALAPEWRARPGVARFRLPAGLSLAALEWICGTGRLLVRGKGAQLTPQAAADTRKPVYWVPAHAASLWQALFAAAGETPPSVIHCPSGARPPPGALVLPPKAGTRRVLEALQGAPRPLVLAGDVCSEEAGTLAAEDILVATARWAAATGVLGALRPPGWPPALVEAPSWPEGEAQQLLPPGAELPQAEGALRPMPRVGDLLLHAGAPAVVTRVCTSSMTMTLATALASPSSGNLGSPAAGSPTLTTKLVWRPPALPFPVAVTLRPGSLGTLVLLPQADTPWVATWTPEALRSVAHAARRLVVPPGTARWVQEAIVKGPLPPTASAIRRRDTLLPQALALRWSGADLSGV